MKLNPVQTEIASDAMRKIAAAEAALEELGDMRRITREARSIVREARDGCNAVIIVLARFEGVDL